MYVCFCGCSYPCAVCFASVLDCMCVLLRWLGAYVHSKPSHFLHGHGATPQCPQCPNPVTILLCVFTQLGSSLVQLSTPPPLPFLCLFRIHYPDFFPLSFLPDSQATAVPNSLALHFFKATFKKQVAPTAHS